jgi:hypothetical protein
VSEPSPLAAVAAAAEAAEEEQEQTRGRDAHGSPEDGFAIGLALAPPPVRTAVEGVLIGAPNASVDALAVAVAPDARPLLGTVAAARVVGTYELGLGRWRRRGIGCGRIRGNRNS